MKAKKSINAAAWHFALLPADDRTSSYHSIRRRIRFFTGFDWFKKHNRPGNSNAHKCIWRKNHMGFHYWDTHFRKCQSQRF